MKPENVNKEWALSVTFAQFCKDANIKNLSDADQKKLYEAVTGKKLKNKGEEN